MLEFVLFCAAVYGLYRFLKWTIWRARMRSNRPLDHTGILYRHAYGISVLVEIEHRKQARLGISKPINWNDIANAILHHFEIVGENHVYLDYFGMTKSEAMDLLEYLKRRGKVTIELENDSSARPAADGSNH